MPELQVVEPIIITPGPYVISDPVLLHGIHYSDPVRLQDPACASPWHSLLTLCVSTAVETHGVTHLLVTLCGSYYHGQLSSRACWACRACAAR